MKIVVTSKPDQCEFRDGLFLNMFCLQICFVLNEATQAGASYFFASEISSCHFVHPSSLSVRHLPTLEIFPLRWSCWLNFLFLPPHQLVIKKPQITYIYLFYIIYNIYNFKQPVPPPSFIKLRIVGFKQNSLYYNKDSLLFWIMSRTFGVVCGLSINPNTVP